MYTSDELNILPSAVEKIFGAMENDIMQDIINRIAENDEITRTADWEMFRMRCLGAVNDDIQSRIKTALNLSNDVLEHMFEKVIEDGYARDEEMYKTTGKQFIPYEENKELQQLVQAVKNQTRGEFFNITGTMGFSVKKPSGNKEFQSIDNYFKDVLDKASMHVLNGTYDYNSMINKVVNEMTNSGVRTIDYESGYSNRVEVAARRAILTGTNQVTSKISEENMKKLDTEYVEVSWHSTARPTHQIWQGRVFHWKKNLEKNDERSTIKMNLQFFSSNSKDYKTVILPKQEYAKVMSELNTHMSDTQRKQKVVTKAIGEYIYTVENNGFDNYRVIGKKLIDNDVLDWWEE